MKHASQSPRSNAVERIVTRRPRLLHRALRDALAKFEVTRELQAAFLDIHASQLADYINHGVPRSIVAAERIERLAALLGYVGPLFQGGSR